VDQNTGEKIETVFFDCVGCSKTLTPWKTIKGQAVYRPYSYYNYYPEMYCQDLHN
jgi:hypothetical protein